MLRIMKCLKKKIPLVGSSSCESNKHEEKILLNTTENFNPKIQQNNSTDDDNINSQSKEEMGEEKSNIVVEGDYFSSGYCHDSESIFFKVFEELLSKADSENGHDCDDGPLVVDYEKLRLGLISTGKFFAGDAVLIIEHMKGTGQIQETDFHRYSRKAVPPNIESAVASYNGF